MKMYNRKTLMAGLMLTIAFILLISESDSILTLLLTKVIGFSLGYVAIRLLRYWESHNKIHLEE